MTREEAIKILKSMSDISTQGEAIDMAIESLSADITDMIVEYDVEYLPDKDGIHQAKATITKAEVI